MKNKKFALWQALVLFTSWILIRMIVAQLTGDFEIMKFLLQIITTWIATIGTFYFFSNKTFKPLNHDATVGMIIVTGFLIMFLQIFLVVLYLFIF
ncbi:hypothetical protein ACEN4P_08745 [Marinilactibacillus psychrotolerans]|uniref:hypothetical protein n=1 Tax=Marinilactibacillus psychrotolerans TaxID=191770 RepID=UPI0038874557